MIQDPEIKEVHPDDDEPATKGFVRESIDELAQVVHRGFEEQAKVMATKDELQEVKDELKGDIAGLASGMKAMMAILEENNQLLNELRRLPERVERLERSVFRR